MCLNRRTDDVRTDVGMKQIAMGSSCRASGAQLGAVCRGGMEGTGGPGGKHICVRVTDSLLCTTETSTAL